MLPLATRSPYSAARHAVIEPLESRIAPAFSGTPSGTVLTISDDHTGDSESATISLEAGRLEMLVLTNTYPHYTTEEFDLTGITSIVVSASQTALREYRSITLDLTHGSIATPERSVTLDGSRSTFGSPSFSLVDTTSLSKPPSLVAVWDPDAANGGTIEISGGMYRYAKVGLSFSRFWKLTINTPAGPDDFQVTGWQDGSSGYNTVKFGQQSATFRQTVFVNLDLAVNDGGSEVSDHLKISDVPIDASTFNVYLGEGDDSVQAGLLSRLSFSSPRGHLYFGGGNDELDITSGYVLGELEVDGGTGFNSLSYKTSGLGFGSGMRLSGSGLSLLALPNYPGLKIVPGTFQAAALTGDSNAQTFDVGGWTGTANLVGGGGSDRIVAASDSTAFVLSDGVLRRSSHGDATLTGFAGAQLSGNGSSFNVSGWTHTVALTSNAGDGSVIAANNGPFLLTDGSLWRDNLPPVTLSGITNAKLTGISKAPAFDVSGWTGTAQLTASLADGSIAATNDVDFSLGEDFLKRTDHGEIILKGIHTASLTGGPSANLFDLTGFSGSAVPDGLFRIVGSPDATVDGAGGDDTVRIFGTGNAVLTPSTLYVANTEIAVAGMEHFELQGTGLAYTGDDAPREITWNPVYDAARSGTLVITDAAGTTTVAYTGSLSVSHVTKLTLLTPSGPDSLFLGEAALAGDLTVGRLSASGYPIYLASFTQVRDLFLDLGSNDASAQADAIDVEALFAVGLQNLTISTGGGDDSLTFGTGNGFRYLPVAGGAFLFDGGPGQDSVSSTCDDAAIIVSPTQLITSGASALDYRGVESFDLFSPAGITVTGTGSESFTARPSSWQQGTVEFLAGDGVPATLHYHSPITLTNAASLQFITANPFDNYTLSAETGYGELSTEYYPKRAPSVLVDKTRFSDIGSVTINIGEGDGPVSSNHLQITSLQVSGLAQLMVKGGAGDDTLELTPTVADLRTCQVSFDAGEGRDIAYLSADLSMLVGETSVSYQDNTAAHTNLGQIRFVGGTVEYLTLVGGPSANRFQIGQWSHQLDVDGGWGDDVFEFVPGSSLTGPVYLGGGYGDDTFILQSTSERRIEGAGEKTIIEGGPGIDTLRAQGDVNFHLDDLSFSRTIPASRTSAALTVTMQASLMENAVLIGGNSPNLLDALGFSGHADLVGEGGVDNLIASKGGGALYGFHYGIDPTDAERHDRSLYSRDNFYMPDGSLAAEVELHANHVAGNVISFRYYQSHDSTGITYTLPNHATGAEHVVSAKGQPLLSVSLAEGRLTAVEGSAYADRLTGNSQINFLIGGAGDDTLTAVGFDYLFGGAGADHLFGITPFRYQDAGYHIPQTSGATAIPIRPLADDRLDIPSEHHRYLSEAISITNRYFTSPFSMRS